MKTLHADRLMKLARFLYNVLPRRKFDFEYVVSGKDIPNKEYDCGTVGCAIGWTPHVFPQRFAFKKSIDVVGLYDRKLGTFMTSGLSVDVVKDFFGLNVNDTSALFAPECQHDHPHLKKLGVNATPKQVAKNIATHVKKELPNFDTSL